MGNVPSWRFVEKRKHDLWTNSGILQCASHIPSTSCWMAISRSLAQVCFISTALLKLPRCGCCHFGGFWGGFLRAPVRRSHSVRTNLRCHMHNTQPQYPVPEICVKNNVGNHLVPYSRPPASSRQLPDPPTSDFLASFWSWAQTELWLPQRYIHIPPGYPAGTKPGAKRPYDEGMPWAQSYHDEAGPYLHANSHPQ